MSNEFRDNHGEHFQGERGEEEETGNEGLSLMSA